MTRFLCLPALTVLTLLPFGALAGDWETDGAKYNVCGLTEARMLSDPAILDYEAAIQATSAWDEIVEKELVGKKSDVEYIRLYQEAQADVLSAAVSFMNDNGHCSVWKFDEDGDETVRRKGAGDPAPDITEDVIAIIEG